MLQEGGDVNVFTVAPPAIPKLLKDEEIALATSSPVHGGADALFNDELVPVWWDNVIIPENGLGDPNFASYVTWGEFFDENPEGIGAVFRADQRSATWFHEKAPEVVPNDPELIEPMSNTSSKEVAQWVMDWLTADTRGIVDEVKYANSAPTTYQSLYITDEYVEGNIKFGEAGQDLGLVPIYWLDGVKFEKFVPPQGTDDLAEQPPF